MLETKCVGNNVKMLVTIFAILVTNINYHFKLANIQKVSPKWKFCYEHQEMLRTPTWSLQVTNITVTPISPQCTIIGSNKL